MDRIKHIQELQEKEYKVTKRQSIVLNNFYSIITIVVISLSVIIYTNYLRPAQLEKEKRELQIKKKQEYLELRAKQIALSHKLNNKDNK
ncbi:MAG: hypothetical protein U9O56_02105 [Campylobacterota bacterium]|nr:hypothetical protein [Campylobacterota bacterium]